MLLDGDIARQFMDIMNDQSTTQDQSFKLLMILAADVREQQAELDGMDLNDCGDACKL